MPANTDHPCFSQPVNAAAPIWRYLDFAKFVSMLESKALYFARADTFEDLHEGSYSGPTSKKRATLMGMEGFPTAIEAMRANAEWHREWTYINCWHMNEHESAAMWSIYSRTDGVALRSTYDKLRLALPDEVYLGTVNYIDYETEEMPSGNTFWPYVYKRKPFEHEREVRGIIQSTPVDGVFCVVGTPNPDKGKLVSVKIEDLVEAVYIAPTASLSFAARTEQVIIQHRFAIPVRHSSLDSLPKY